MREFAKIRDAVSYNLEGHYVVGVMDVSTERIGGLFGYGTGH